MFSRLRAWQRQRTARRYRVDEAQWATAEARLPFLRFLPPADRPRLRRLALELLAEKQMTGARGLQLSNEMRLCIALQACLPILNLGLDWYGGWVGIVVYPGDFVIPRRVADEAGVVHEYEDLALGEAWEGGPVVLSWQDRAGDTDDGVNVVVHEFAHKLDMLDGDVDGVPRLRPDMSRAEWIAAFEPTYREFQAHVARGETSWLDPYAAEHPAEFFAVATEAFFETPLLLQEDCPAVYRQLARLYGQDPATAEAALSNAESGLAQDRADPEHP
jgi:Mlc titration factor MtfA (ptsG expression regulator)